MISILFSKDKIQIIYLLKFFKINILEPVINYTLIADYIWEVPSIIEFWAICER